jgi:hypothetical protein
MGARAAALLAAVWLWAGGACTPEFDNSTTIKDLRLIAIQADPPEILIDLPAVMENPALLAGLPTVRLSPLVVDPRGGGRPVEYTVQACGNRPEGTERGSDNGPGRVNDTISQAPCPDGAMSVAQGAAVPVEDGMAPIDVTFRPTPELLVQAVMADPISLELGLPITLSFTFRAGDEQVVAIKRVLFSPVLRPDHVPNRNPQITHLSVRATREDPPAPIDPAAPPSVAPGAKLRVMPAPGEAEPYLARAFSRTERRFVTEEIPQETLRYTFYATQGTFSPGGMSTFPSPLRNDPANEIETTYEAPLTLPADGKREVFLFVVVRDERGGSSFIRSRLLLGPPGAK